MDNIERLHLMLDSLSKSQTLPVAQQRLYAYMQNELEKASLGFRTDFTSKQIDKVLALDLSGLEMANFHLEKSFSSFVDAELKAKSKSIIVSLLEGNFSAHKKELKKGFKEFEASLSEVETKMYLMINSYIQIITQALCFYMIFDTNKSHTAQELSLYAIKVHDLALDELFFEEERVHVAESLRQILVVFISLYYEHFYLKG